MNNTSFPGLALFDHAVCAVRGHVSQRGRNGWQNLGTGTFCRRCGVMLDAAGQVYDFEAELRSRAAARVAAGFDDEAHK